MKSKLVVVNWLFFLTAVIHFAAVADAAYAAKEHPASAGGYAILLNTEGEGTEWVGTDEMRVAQVSTPSERRQAVDEGYFSVQRKGLTVGGWGDRISRDDIQALAQTGATLTRVFIRTKNCDKCTQFNLVPSELPKVDLVLQEASKLGVRVVIALQLSTKRYWDDPMLQKSVSLIWADVARRYKGNESIVGFDLINEPNPPRSMSDEERRQKWEVLALQIVEAIRAEDPERTIVYEPIDDANAKSFRKLRPLGVPNVVYEVHVWDPGAFTHQGVFGFKTGVPYPTGPQFGIGVWNKQALDALLEPVRQFERTHKVPIYIGEFGCSRHAPRESRYQWIRDTIDLFNKEQWSWTFHAFREFHSWDPEIEAEDPGDRRREASGRLMEMLRSELRNAR